MPILRLLLGLPRRIFFSGAADFFGGILFFTAQGDEVENKRRVKGSRVEARCTLTSIEKSIKTNKDFR